MNPDQTAPLREQSDLGPFCLQYWQSSPADENQTTFVLNGRTLYAAFDDYSATIS